MSAITLVSYCHLGHANWIPHWIEQIKKQTFQDFKILFIAHNWPKQSSSEELMLLQNELGNRLRYGFYESEPIIGKVINFANEIVDTEYFAHFDVDDIMHVDRLKIQAEFLEANPHMDFCGTRGLGFWGEVPPAEMLDISFYDRSTDVLRYIDEPVHWDTNRIKECMLKYGYNCLPHGSMIYKVGALRKIGGFDLSDVKTNGLSPDFETWKKALRAGMEFARLPQLMYYWRQGSSVIRK